MKDLDISYREALLIELTHLLSHGTEEEMGLSLPEIINFLDKRLKGKDNIKVLHLLERDGREFLIELKRMLNQSPK